MVVSGQLRRYNRGIAFIVHLIDQFAHIINDHPVNHEENFYSGASMRRMNAIENELEFWDRYGGGSINELSVTLAELIQRALDPLDDGGLGENNFHNFQYQRQIRVLKFYIFFREI